MATSLKKTTKRKKAPARDPFRYGWRVVCKRDSRGVEHYREIPLKLSDFLHPREGDHFVDNAMHEDICSNLKSFLLWWAAEQRGVVVQRNMRIDFGVPGLKPLGPDISAFRNVPADVDPFRGTFRVAKLGAISLFVVEVTSPSTRKIDLNQKVKKYEQAGVPCYVIVDQEPTASGYRLRLLGYRASPAGFVPILLDERGRLWLAEAKIWLAIEDNKLVCYDENNVRLKEYTEEVQARQQAEEEKERAEKEKERAEKKLAKEARERKVMEKRLREMEAELQRLRNKGNSPSEP